MPKILATTAVCLVFLFGFLCAVCEAESIAGSRTGVNWKVMLALCGFITLVWPLSRLSFAEESVPDWTLWKCTKPIVSFNTIETYECHLPSDEQSTAIQLKLTGNAVPFLIGWNYVKQSDNPVANAYTALYKNGRWIVGARGTGFTTENKGSSIIFHIFLAPNFAVREQLEIKIAEDDEN